ncbi:uncharacterized protein PGRI_013320 [Penicillium griseofulvum]|uniref:Uncharacterized protein n=1 Tax=Penicillium patulum TaxID=5078 RepID=A0A135LEQ9_PENPA|nr:uncharacterized protein PGRI_013320 [Penicillium griseofulvum]KXG47462.1 hypothetical protein PGRI_013320 [Penicillium griseofulvum]
MNKMTKPNESDDPLRELKPGDVKLLIYASLCHNGRIDMEKLAGYLGQKKSSASTNYFRAKGRFQAILNERSPRKSASANAAPKSGAAGESINPASTDTPVKKPRSRKPAYAASKATAASETIGSDDTDPGTLVKKPRSHKPADAFSKFRDAGKTIGSDDTDPGTSVEKPRSRKRAAAKDASSGDEAEAKRRRLAPWAAWIASVGDPGSPPTTVPNYTQQAASEPEESVQTGMANEASDLTE